MKILIIGSNGFIGSHAYDYFKSIAEVWGADIAKSDQSNYYTLDKSDSNFDVIFENNQFDVCINASGNGSVPISLTQPVLDFHLNVFNTIKVLDSIRKHNPLCKFINLSSAAVYGNPVSQPIKESIPLKPLSPYGWHKLYAEQICREYFYLYKIETINLRLFSVYGERLKKQLFWDIYQKALRTQKIELFGTGKETRDFIYIQDLIRAIHIIMDHGLFNGEAINVGSGVETTVAEAANTFCNALANNITIEFNKIVKPGDPLRWKADISILQSFGFAAQTSISKGLTNTAEWLKKNV